MSAHECQPLARWFFGLCDWWISSTSRFSNVDFSKETCRDAAAGAEDVRGLPVVVSGAAFESNSASSFETSFPPLDQTNSRYDTRWWRCENVHVPSSGCSRREVVRLIPKIRVPQVQLSRRTCTLVLTHARERSEPHLQELGLVVQSTT